MDLVQEGPSKLMILLHFEEKYGQRWSRGSSVGIVSDYGLEDRDLIPDRGRGFSL
jgi:hypothetical protein